MDESAIFVAFASLGDRHAVSKTEPFNALLRLNLLLVCYPVNGFQSLYFGRW
jgi:hypothetical protein